MKTFRIRKFIRCARTGSGIRTEQIVRGDALLEEHITLSSAGLVSVLAAACDDASSNSQPRRFA